MIGHARAGVVVAVVVASALALLGPRSAVMAAEYELDSVALYEVRPIERDVEVSVRIAFTNTTPDPAGRFSVFDEVRLAIHDQPTDVAAADEEGNLDVGVEQVSGVTVATIALREAIRYQESAELELTYRIVDGAGDEARIGPQLVVFPAWGFGTSSEVDISIPAGYEVRVDGDGLSAGTDGLLTSGPIDDPAAWLAIVTAVGPKELTSLDAMVTLDGATAKVVVRAFADDPAWGEAMRDVVVQALPLLERAIGLPFPLVGQLGVTQGVPGSGEDFGDQLLSPGEIVVAHDQPPFTLVHQLAHLWIAPPLVESRWIAEGMASDLAAEVADEIDLEPPFDPAEEAERLAGDAEPLDSWDGGASPAFASYAHARAWQLMSELRAEMGEDAFAAILARTAASIGPYDGDKIGSGAQETPRYPLTSRTLLDQVAAVSGIDAAERFAEMVLADADAALLPGRAAARESFDALLVAADGWGAPDAVRAAMTEWRFDDAGRLMDEAAAWLEQRDELLAEIERVGLARPERLLQAYRAYGGGPESVDELETEAAVVEAYAAAADRVNQPRGLLARLGLVGSTDPATELDRANGLFADGDLRGAMTSIEQAQRIADAAETSGIVRLISLVLLVSAMAVVAVVVFRRRASYTAAP